MNLTVVSFAVYGIESGSCGENVNWTFEKATGTLTISGEGEMKNYIQSYFVPWVDFLDSITTVTIKNGVRSIGEHAFADCIALASVEISESVTEIGYNAFWNSGCYNEASNWENKAFYIGNCLIETYKSLSGDYVVKNGTRLIADRAFYKVKENSFSVTVPGTITHIGDEAFCNSLLTTVTIHEGVKYIGDSVFAHTPNLESVQLPDSIERVGIDTFYDSYFADQEENYENDALYVNKCFFGTKAHAALELPEVYEIKPGTKVIAGHAINAPGVKKFILPDTIISIGDAAFGRDLTGHGACTELEEIDLSHLKNLKYLGAYAFSGCTTLEKATMPENIENIGESAFSGCESLKELTLTTNIKEIGSDAFNGCDALTDIYFDGDYEQWDNIDKNHGNDVLTKDKLRPLEQDDPTIPNVPVFPSWPQEHGRVHSVTIKDDISLRYKDSIMIYPEIVVDDDVQFTKTFYSTNKSVATVNYNGKVTATGSGQTVITCEVTDEYGNKETGSCVVNVKLAWWQWVLRFITFGWY